jgi:Uma2 family endonuclease
MDNKRKRLVTNSLLQRMNQGAGQGSTRQGAMDRSVQSGGSKGDGQIPSAGQQSVAGGRLHPDVLLGQLVLAQATDLARSGRYVEAKKLLKENNALMQDLMPGVFDLHARMYAQQGYFREAQINWSRALQLDPTNEAYVAGLLRLRGQGGSRWPRSAKRAGSPPQQATHVSTLSSSDGLLLARQEDGRWQYELVKGHLVKNPIAGGSHDYLVYRLTLMLGAFIELHNLGVITLSQTGYNVTLPGERETVWVPDLAFVQSAHVPAEDSLEWSRNWNVAPDLVVQVASPGQSRQDASARANGWLERGVRLVWVFWPGSKTVDVWLPTSDRPETTLRIEDTLDGLDVIAAFTCPLTRIFRSAGGTTS